MRKTEWGGDGRVQREKGVKKARGVKKAEGVKKARGIDAVAMLLYKKVCICKLPLFSKGQVEADLIQLYPGKNLEWLRTEYYVRKLSLFLKILLIGGLLAIAARASADANILLREGGVLQRGELGEEEKRIQMKADYGETSYDFRLVLGARQPTREEAEEWLETLQEELPGLIAGENENTDRVSGNLLLREQYGEFPVKVEWESSSPELISETGEVQPAEKEQTVLLTATLACGEYSEETSIPVTLIPESVSREEQIYRQISHYLSQQEEAGRKDESFTLPQTWEGKTLLWSQKKEDKSNYILVGSIAAALLAYLFSDHDLHEKLKKRKRTLQEEYPKLVHELVLLVGAGMTTRRAFQKMASDYEKKKTSTGRVSFAYEEIVHSCREMQSGVAEGAAYERMGRRTGVQQYIRLSGLLMQNLKRGNRMLTERLREEAYKVGEERLQLGRKKAEEAGTRILLPMVMMLGVVMLLIMLPAFSGL